MSDVAIGIRSMSGLLLMVIVIAATVSCFSQSPAPANEQPIDRVVTVDPGVHLFDVHDFQKTLAKWIQDHPEHEVMAMAKAEGRAYYVVTRVDPRFLNNVLPGARPPDDDIPVPFGRAADQ